MQVKYLGGITFLLKDRCPESATAGEISRYEQCAANEILHVGVRLSFSAKITTHFRPSVSRTGSRPGTSSPSPCSQTSAVQCAGASLSPGFTTVPIMEEGEKFETSIFKLYGLTIFRLDGKGNGGSQKVDQALADRFLG